MSLRLINSGTQRKAIANKVTLCCLLCSTIYPPPHIHRDGIRVEQQLPSLLARKTEIGNKSSYCRSIKQVISLSFLALVSHIFTICCHYLSLYYTYTAYNKFASFHPPQLPSYYYLTNLPRIRLHSLDYPPSIHHRVSGGRGVVTRLDLMTIPMTPTQETKKRVK